MLKSGAKGVLLAFGRQFVGTLTEQYSGDWTLNCKDTNLLIDSIQLAWHAGKSTRDWKWFPFPDEPTSEIPQNRRWIMEEY